MKSLEAALNLYNQCIKSFMQGNGEVFKFSKDFMSPVNWNNCSIKSILLLEYFFSQPP